ncbi:ABC transporter ATP-binding protein [Bengtsoniella intestinalis]|uniref:ABC transporter ATP-binding protein n=1 Tax=Bengtsoniella intestinalis TaxID=3073143 RepID=UPI00391FA0AB
MSSIIRVENVCKTFVDEKSKSSNEVLQNINFEIEENEFVVIFGPGQSGKTTLMNIIAGLETATSGEVYIKDKLVTSAGPDRAMVFQNILLFPWLTVRDNVEYSMKVRGFDKEEMHREAQKYLDLVGLQGFEDAFPVKISGGMKQRVGIARAYCAKPDVMLMDEPFGALDAQTRYLMQEEVIRIRNQEKRTIIFVTNNIEEALYLADRIIVVTECPSKVMEAIKIDLPRPRDYVSEEFLRLRKEISAMTNRAR